MNLVTKAEMIQRDLNQPWIHNQVTFQLNALAYWVRWGYQLNDHQKEILEEIKKGVENE